MSRSERSPSGPGTSGIGRWCSMPSAGSWKEAVSDSRIRPSCRACTRRAEKLRPSRIRSTTNWIGRRSSPGRRK
ncbi:hypothetical protein [Ornithinimicrobium kibberense]|uniref:hypothetical protein n=1 Tax=Ornithinimicrobium kibberense TaxID=282060 RepID=UPI003611213F